MKILFVDDEMRRMEPVIEELQEAGYEVVAQDSVDAALKCLENRDEKFDLIVIDISMPPGRAFREEDTDSGARTGLSLYREIRKMRPGAKVVVFTNVAHRGIEEHFKTERPSLWRVIRKTDVLPFQFVEEIEKFVSDSPLNTQRLQ